MRLNLISFMLKDRKSLEGWGSVRKQYCPNMYNILVIPNIFS